MTQDERNMLADLANKIAQTPAPPRDPEAEDYIRSSIGKRPDALYLMTQTVLIQNMALQRAQQQIQDLQQRATQPVPSGGSFLGQSAPQYSGAAQQYGSGQQYPPQYAPAPGYGAPAPSAMSGFLRSAAQTAAGVAAGTLAVEGIESLFSHHGGYGGFGGGSGFGGFGGGQPTEIIENNYYGSDPHEARGGDRFADAGSNSDVANDLAPQDADFDDSDNSTDNSSDDSNYDNSSDDSTGGDNFS